MKVYIPFVLVVIFSCNENKEAGKIDYTIADLVLSCPKEVKFIRGNGIDSYVSYLINEKGDTFHIEYGSKGIIYRLYDGATTVFHTDEKERMTKRLGFTPGPEQALFSDDPKEDEPQNTFDKNYYMYDTVNGIVVKLVQPKRIGNGITGMYAPNLRKGNSLSIYANGLDSFHHKQAMDFFKTLRYK